MKQQMVEVPRVYFVIFQNVLKPVANLECDQFTPERDNTNLFWKQNNLP